VTMQLARAGKIQINAIAVRVVDRGKSRVVTAGAFRSGRRTLKSGQLTWSAQLIEAVAVGA
jgi:hypothetical protein